MKKLIILLLLISTYSTAQTKIWAAGVNVNDDQTINVAATEYIIILNSSGTVGSASDIKIRGATSISPSYGFDLFSFFTDEDDDEPSCGRDHC